MKVSVYRKRLSKSLSCLIYQINSSLLEVIQRQEREGIRVVETNADRTGPFGLGGAGDYGDPAKTWQSQLYQSHAASR